MAENFDDIMAIATTGTINVGDLEGWTSDELDSLREVTTVGSTNWYSALSAVNVYGGTEYTSGGAFDLFDRYGEETWSTYIEQTGLPDTMDWMDYFAGVLEEGGYNAYSLYSQLSSPLNVIDVQLHPERYDPGNFSLSNIDDYIDKAITGTADLAAELIVEPYTLPTELGLDFVGLDEESQLVSDLADEGKDIVSESLEPVIEGMGVDLVLGTSGVATIEGITESVRDFDDVLEQNLNEAGDIIKDYLGVEEGGGETGYDFNVPSPDDVGSVYGAGQRYGRRETIYSDLPTDWKTPRETLTRAPEINDNLSQFGFEWLT